MRVGAMHLKKVPKHTYRVILDFELTRRNCIRSMTNQETLKFYVIKADSVAMALN